MRSDNNNIPELTQHTYQAVYSFCLISVII